MFRNRRVTQAATQSLKVGRFGWSTLYLHPGRVEKAFIGYLGGVDSYSQATKDSTDLTVEGGADFKIVNFKLGAGGSIEGGATVNFDMKQPLAQALVLRAFLQSERLLWTNDVQKAPTQALVMVWGEGAISFPARNVVAGIPAWVPSGVAEEVLSVYEKRLGLRPDPTDPVVQYFLVFANTAANGIVVSFAGYAELDHGERAYVQGRTASGNANIFGRMSESYPEWTLIEPLHIWFQ
jgi:hypothetical protein